ncbi:hypothetical protein BDZ89DRAFT_1134119 [Hymenopellis radicata]|nr:hypothetical protein BDZ89DRAFT_1134119 [Hymenopellis radicata]
MDHNNYEDFAGKDWIELDWGQQKHWENLGRDIIGCAFDAARRDAEVGSLLVSVLFDLPDLLFKTLPRTGGIPTKTRPKNKKPYERESPKASGASRRKLRREHTEQSAPVEPPVVSMPPVRQDQAFEFPVQYQGALPFDLPSPLQYPMPLPFDIPIPQYPMMGPSTVAFALDFDPYFGPPPVMAPMEYYPCNDPMRLVPEVLFLRHIPTRYRGSGPRLGTSS